MASSPEPYSARELYIQWLTTKDKLDLDNERICATMISLNKPAFELAALLQKKFELDQILEYYDLNELLEKELEKIISPLIIQCSTNTEWENVKIKIPSVTEKIDTYKDLKPPNITVYNGPDIPDNPWNSMSLSQRCDFMMMNKSHQNIEIFATIFDCIVNERWVKFAAGYAINDDLNCIRADTTTLNEFVTRNFSGIIYINIPNVFQLLQAISTLKPQITVIWKLASKCINITKLFNTLNENNIAEDSLQLFYIACSIGLPLHKIFTPWQFLHQWVKEGWFNLNTSEELTLLSLRRRLKPLLKKIGTDVHWSQCIELYRKEYNSFLTSLDHYEIYANTANDVDIEEYFFNHIYSYPTPDEWTMLLIRLNELSSVLNVRIGNRVNTGGGGGGDGDNVKAGAGGGGASKKGGGGFLNSIFGGGR